MYNTVWEDRPVPVTSNKCVLFTLLCSETTSSASLWGCGLLGAIVLVWGTSSCLFFPAVELSDGLPAQTQGELMSPVTGQNEEAPQRLDKRQGERAGQWNNGEQGDGLDEGKAQKRQLCNQQGGKQGERSNSKKQMEPGTTTPIAGVAFSMQQHTSHWSKWGDIGGSRQGLSVFWLCSLKHTWVVFLKKKYQHAAAAPRLIKNSAGVYCKLHDRVEKRRKNWKWNLINRKAGRHWLSFPKQSS